MLIRTKRQSIAFNKPLNLKVAGRALPAGSYEVITDEELIEGLSFAVYRRVSTKILVPGALPAHNSIEMLTVDAKDLDAAIAIDGSE